MKLCFTCAASVLRRGSRPGARVRRNLDNAVAPARVRRIGALRMTATSAKSSKTAAAPSTEIPKGAPTFQEAISRLQQYWAEKGCIVWHPYNHEVGAGTMNPATFLRVLGPEPWSVAYDEPSVRPDDSRYGENPNRVQRHTQFQVILKPAPHNCQELLLGSYKVLGIDTTSHDVRFVEDNWESPALGAWGLGWEVWLDGMEVTQFTYFQQAGGFSCEPISLEITYGLERILMSLQQKTHFKDILFAPGITYGDIFMQNEVEMSKYNLDEASVERNAVLFDTYEKEGIDMIKKRLPVPAFNFLLKASHTFNILDARGAIGVTERAAYFRRMRALARDAASLWYERREELGFPLLNRQSQPGHKNEGHTHQQAVTVDSSTATFAFEIGTEELPADDVEHAARQLETNLSQALQENKLHFSSIKIYATPRRLVAVVSDLDAKQEDTVEDLRGPPKKIAVDESGNMTKAALGFCKKNSVDPETVEWRNVKGQEYLFARIERKGLPTATILQNICPVVVQKIGFIKTMRWNSSNVAFSRPIRWVTALLNDDVISMSHAGVQSGRKTRGVRGKGGIAPELEVSSAEKLEETLRRHGIIADVTERKETVKKMAQDVASAAGGRIPDDYMDEGDGSLLSEVTNLVEMPKPILGRFDEEFLRLPKAVLTTVMKKHQRYFPVMKPDSSELINAFVTMANGPIDEDIVRAGNEAVLRARYSDASFFYDKDRQKQLIDFKPSLDGLVFQEKLGSMLAKNDRVEQVIEKITTMVGGGKDAAKTALRSAELFKADLATNMVVEFTSLAGEMGRHYARQNEESDEVAEAIFEAVLPRSVTDSLPESTAGCALAVADRLDSLVGLFAAGCAPTTNADVFALRRTAVGLVSILMKRGLPLNIRQGVEVLSEVQPILVDDKTKDAVVEFVVRRLESSLLERGIRVDLVRAVIAEQGESPSNVEEALSELVKLAEGEDFATALEVHGRPYRLIRSKGDLISTTTVDEKLFESDIEKNLNDAYIKASSMIKENGASVRSVVDALVSIREPVDLFFDKIFVMSEDELVRSNRLALCANIAALPKGIVDLSQVQ